MSLLTLGIEYQDAFRYRTKCPLCEEPNRLLVIKDETHGHIFDCSACGEGGNAGDGWWDLKSKESGYLTIPDSKQKIWDMYSGLMPAGLPTGWTDLDSHLKWRLGETTLFGGIPGHGKSQFALACALNASVLHDIKWAMFCAEDYPQEITYTKLAETLCGVSFWPWHDPRMGKAMMGEAMTWLKSRFYLITPKKKDLTSILETASLLKRKHGISGVLIDPWNKLEQKRGGQSETDYIGETMDRIIDFSHAKNVLFWLVVHPTKLKREPGSDKEPVPTAQDYHGSAHFFNKTDNAVIVWRNRMDKEETLVNIYVQKVKHYFNGDTGWFKLVFDRRSRRYMNNDMGLIKTPLEGANPLGKEAEK